MRASCNGCRVLRKGCADDCTIRPCLAWIRSPDAQANATVFLAKFYGRAGLINLLAAAPDDAHRPALFRSLLYEACGRAANPVHGASGLFSTGNWEACQAAVQAVLEGRRIPQVGADQAAPHPGLVAAYGVRHIPKDSIDRASAALRVSRASFKRASSSSSAARPKRDGGLDLESAGSHDHVGEDDGKALAGEQKRGHSSSSEAEAGSHVSQAEQSASATVPQVAQDDGEIGLELTLGFGPATRVLRSSPPPPVRFEASSLSAESGHIGLLLGLPV